MITFHIVIKSYLIVYKKYCIKQKEKTGEYMKKNIKTYNYMDSTNLN